MGRNIAAFIFGLLVTIVALGYTASSPDLTASRAQCAGSPFKTAADLNAAIREGYAIHPKYNCIDKSSFIEVNQRRAEQREADEAAAISAARVLKTLAEARREFATGISIHARKAVSMSDPPVQIFLPRHYRQSSGRLLPAYVTPDPQDGLKHPAIIWLPDGDTNSPGAFSNAESTAAIETFRAAGVVVMVPVLRGGEADATGKEFFFGEVDDVLAAADHLTGIGYVNPERIFLGGHGAGGTLALLTAEVSSRFADVIAFGPVADINNYTGSDSAIDFAKLDARERKLRSPIHWLHGIGSPTYVIEGKEFPSNRNDAQALCANSTNPNLRCVLVDGADHISVVAQLSTVIAARMAVSNEIDFVLRAEEFNSTDGKVRLAQLDTQSNP